MKIKNIKPLGDRIQLKIDEPSVGVLQIEGVPTAIECGEVIALGDLVIDIKKGDKVFFKSWAVDIITYEGKRYYFISQSSKGICALIS